MSVTFTSTLVDTLEAFVYYNSDYQSSGPNTQQPFNNSPDNSSAEQYTYVTGSASDGIDIKYTNSYVSIQGTDSKGNIYYWISFLIDPPSNSNALDIATVTQANTVIDLDTKKYNILYVCDPNTPCPNGLGCFADPITKKNYCTGIGYGSDGVNWIMIFVLIFIVIIMIAVASFLAFKLFHVVNVSKV